jgi:hypothetical protein
MEVKVHCRCGTRFAFEVEPVNGRMPVRVKCPDCGADGTDFANEVIRQKLGGAAAPLPPVAVAVTAASMPLPVPPGPAQPSARVAAPQPVAAPAAPVAAAAAVIFCARHPKNPATETCRVCGKPICDECIEIHGHACSIYCRKQTGETDREQPRYTRQQAVMGDRVARVGALILRAAVLLMVIVMGAWGWYAFWGSRPRVIYAENLPHGDRARFYQFLVPDQVLSIKANQMSLFDLAQQKQLWSVPLNVGFAPPPPRNPSKPDSEEQVELYPPPHVTAASNDLWILFPGQLVQYDRRSGNRKQEISLNPPFFGLTESDHEIAAISADASDRQVVTRVALADGSVRTVPIEASPPAAPPANRSRPPAGPAKPVVRESLGDKFMADGAGVVQMKVDLIERRTIVHSAMKPVKQSLVDDRLTAGQSMEAVEREMNQMRREQTGGVVEEDVSRYEVTLRRLLAGAAPDWTGEVIGPPSFYPLKNLGVLVSGKTIQVFDKHNRRLWGANLTYSVAPHYSRDFATESDPPCVEAGNTLYVFDQGMLTSFEAATGNVHWRLTSVGISQVQLDKMKNLYVTSTTASPDSLQFSREVDLSARINPVVLKVEAATGRVLWRNEGLGDTCYLSGKFVYLSRAMENTLAPGEDPIVSFDLYRLSPSDGHAIWNYSQFRHPVQVEVHGTQILIHFRGALQVLKFLSL